MRTKNIIDEFTEACREKGLSVTQQRLAVYQELSATESHPTAEEVYEKLKTQYPTLSLATVYKTLDTFEKNGFISKTRATGESARFDANRMPHHHLICRVCGKIEDLYDRALSQLALPDSVGSEFHVEEYQIDFRGLCRKCKKINDENHVKEEKV